MFLQIAISTRIQLLWYGHSLFQNLVKIPLEKLSKKQSQFKQTRPAASVKQFPLSEDPLI